MSSKKKGFLKAGTILGIVVAVIMLLSAIAVFATKNLVTTDFVKEVLVASEEYVNIEGVIYEKTSTGATGAVLTEEEIKLTVDIIQSGMTMIGIFCIGIGAAMLVVSILLIHKTNKLQYSMGLTIALLVLSLFAGNLITMAFMIVALCIKDPKPTIENINKIAENNL